MMSRLLLIGFMVTMMGCSSGPAGKDQVREWDGSDDLSEVAIIYRSCFYSANKSPASVQDLSRFSSEGPRGYEAVKSGRIVVVWGGKIAGEGGDGGSDKVLAYEKSVTTDGGFVLFENGKVKKMTASEFQAVAPTAK